MKCSIDEHMCHVSSSEFSVIAVNHSLNPSPEQQLFSHSLISYLHVLKHFFIFKAKHKRTKLKQIQPRVLTQACNPSKTNEHYFCMSLWGYKNPPRKNLNENANQLKLMVLTL